MEQIDTYKFMDINIKDYMYHYSSAKFMLAVCEERLKNYKEAFEIYLELKAQKSNENYIVEDNIKNINKLMEIS